MIIKSDGVTPWWVGRTVSCACGFSAILEKKDSLSSQWIGERAAPTGRRVTTACPNCDNPLSVLSGSMENTVTDGGDRVLLLEGRK